MRYKLIVADSSPSVQKVIQLAFQESEFEIFLFENGIDVMENFGKINPDAILLSLSLPGKDVYEVGFYLKSRADINRTSIVFLRGAFESLDQQKMASIDYDEIVQKPFDSVKLAQTVKEIIERKRNPLTLPEEPILEGVNLKVYDPEIQKKRTKEDITSQGEKRSVSSKPSSELESYEAYKEQIQDFITQLGKKMKIELEEKVSGRVLGDLKGLLKKEIDTLKVKISKSKKQKRS